MFFYEGMICPVCERPFVSTDDIVSCPHCGLPHHRACWQRTGNCHLQHLHGTDEQWSKNKQEETEQPTVTDAPQDSKGQACSRCGADNPEFAEYCKRCGNSLKKSDWHSEPARSPFEYTSFSATADAGDAYSEEDQIEEIPTRQYAAIVGAKSHYYIPRFKRLASNNYGGWNWCAFLFGPYWLLYRKMYLGGSLFLLLQFIETVINGYVLHKLDITTVEQLYNAFSLAAQNRTQLFYLLSIWIMSVIILLLRAVIGFAGNSIYKMHCAKQIRRSCQQVPDISPAELSTVGGTSLGVALIGYFVLYFLTQMVTIFFM